MLPPHAFIRRSGRFGCLILLLNPLSLSQAADRYVSKTGSDTNPGTLASPWKTIGKAATVAVAGDVINIRGNGGNYSERVTVNNRDGTAALPIIFQTYPGDPMVVLDLTGTVPSAGLSAVFTITNSDYVTLRNLEIRNYKTSGTDAVQRGQTPVGIYIIGNGNGVAIRNCKVHDIWQSCATAFDAGNGFGIAVYGNNATALNGLILDGNEIYNLRTGSSESVALNGNVINFAVTNNIVHDCNNIGIDFIGFEGTNANAALDQARLGTCASNLVYNIDSKFNPAYGGNFTGPWDDSTRSAPGIYVDGGRDIVIERNRVYACNFALSLGSEAATKVTSNVTARNNIFNHCHVGGIVLGGSDAILNGGASNCAISNNTIYGNDTVGYGGGQIALQNNLTGITIRRNLIASTASFAQLILKDNVTGSFAAGAIDWNYFKINPGSTLEFIWNRLSYDTFAAWKTASSNDLHSTMGTGTVGLVNNAPVSTSPSTDFTLTATSLLRNIGDSASLPFTPAVGEKDYPGLSRVASLRVDIGADEYHTPYQIWLDLYFGLPDGGPNAGTGDDPDRDGLQNLFEYSQGSIPTKPDANLAPTTSMVGGKLRYTYRKAAPELTYTVQQNPTLTGTWSTVSNATSPEQTDGQGNYWRDFPTSASRGFFRLKVTQP